MQDLLSDVRVVHFIIISSIQQIPKGLSSMWSHSSLRRVRDASQRFRLPSELFQLLCKFSRPFKSKKETFSGMRHSVELGRNVYYERTVGSLLPL